MTAIEPAYSAWEAISRLEQIFCPACSEALAANWNSSYNCAFSAVGTRLRYGPSTATGRSRSGYERGTGVHVLGNSHPERGHPFLKSDQSGAVKRKIRRGRVIWVKGSRTGRATYAHLTPDGGHRIAPRAQSAPPPNLSDIGAARFASERLKIPCEIAVRGGWGGSRMPLQCSGARITYRVTTVGELPRPRLLLGRIEEIGDE